MTDIFERVKSPFYHFGMLMRLNKIPYEDFKSYIADRLKDVSEQPTQIADEILVFYKLPSILHATAFIRSLEQPGSWQKRGCTPTRHRRHHNNSRFRLRTFMVEFQ